MYHEPVMGEEVVQNLLWRNPGDYVDCTAGGGGHSSEIAARLLPGSTLVSLDRDAEAIVVASERLSPYACARVVHKRFGELADVIPEASADGILFDLGVSSHQLDDPSRGFTFAGDAPLDLRMNQDEGESVQQFLLRTDDRSLAFLLSSHSDLDRAPRLARALIAARKSAMPGLLSSASLRTVVQSVFPDRPREQGSIAARVLQALRMELNGELDEIQSGMNAAVQALRSGGRLCVLTYHSVEDRAVKTAMAVWERDCICPREYPMCLCGGKQRKIRKVLRKPGLPTDAEVARNSRARSAKLRVYERV